MPEPRSSGTRSSNGSVQGPRSLSIYGAVAAAAIPAVAISGLAAAAPATAVEAPASKALLLPRPATAANIASAKQRIAAHLVASHVPARVTVAAAAPRSVSVKSGDTLSGIAHRHHTSVATLLKANNLSASDLIFPGQKIKLSGSSSSKNSSSRSAGVASRSSSYTVKSGDTLSGIAHKHHMGLSQLLKSSGLTASKTIHPGQKIRLSGGSGSSVKVVANSTTRIKSAGSPKATSYAVKAGDTLSGIANKHHMSLSELLKSSGLTASKMIKPGQKIRLSGGSASVASSGSSKASSPSKSSTYTVRAGDTLSGIAAEAGMGLSKLLKANHLSKSSVIRVGQKLKTTGGSSVATTSSRKQLVSDTFLHYKYPASTVKSANENKHVLLSRNLPSRAAMKSLISSTASQMGVDPSLALAHAYQESGFNMAAVSPANAIGAMQVIPSSGEWASQLVGRKLDLLNPRDNVTAGIAIIRSLQRTSKSVEIGIASYYQGQGSVKRNGMYSDTKSYVHSVRAHQKKFK